MNRPIIYTDIDGVLNNCSKDDQVYYEIDGVRQVYYMNQSCIDEYNKLVKETNAVAVITSVWRHNKTIEDMQKIFDYFGVEVEIIGLTERFANSSRSIYRGNEIDRYHRDNVVGDVPYVILDDDSDMLYWQRNYFVPVDNWSGLTRNTVFRAQRILEGKF